MKKNRTIDLFAGIGGVRIGFEKAGFETVFANDFDPYCKKTYDLNFDFPKLTVADISQIKSRDIPDFDILLGGFPCQPFSIAGLRKGFEDEERGNLFFEVERIIRDKQPSAFLLENVKNLRSHDSGNTYRVIKEKLQNLGYFVTEEILNSMEYGNVPQNRERIYIAGFKSEESYSLFRFPEKTQLTKSIMDVLDKEVDEKYYYNDKPLYEKLKDEVVLENTVYQWRRKYVRANKKGVCPTLTANMGTGGHNVPIIKDHKGIRKLTPKECLRIQGFPESYKLPLDVADSRLYKQIGNSVTTIVMEKVAIQMSKALDFEYETKSVPRLVPQTIS